MANFIFNWASAALANSTLDLGTGNYYAHLVTTAPLLANSTVADLVLPTASGYISTALTGLSLTSARWTFTSFDFPKYIFATAPIGVVICKRAGATPATTDQIICYSDFNNSLGQTISLQIGTYVVNLQFGSNGAINFAYRYQYSSGTFDPGLVPPQQGIFYLLGTANNTIAWTNPAPAKVAITNATIGSSTSFFVNLSTTAQGTANTSPTIFDFLTRTCRVGTCAVRASNSTTGIYELQGSQDGSSWTALGSITNLTAGWNLITCSNQTFFRYFRFNCSTSTSIANFEFFNSAILSPNQNLT